MPLLTDKELADISPIFRGNAGNILARLLMRIFSVNSLNDLYDRNCSFQGEDFARTILNELNIKYSIKNSDALANMPEGAFITISNHPYGSIDGVILVDMFGHLRNDYKVIVNKILSRIRALDRNFINVTPKGNEMTARPTKDSIFGIREAVSHVKNGHPLGIFPSGAVSDFSLRDGCVRDRQWQEPIIRMIKRLRVPILPVKFLGGNSPFFYSLGLIDWRVRILRLPAEVLNKRNKTQELALGNIILPEEQDRYENINDFGVFLRNKVYNLK